MSRGQYGESREAILTAAAQLIRDQGVGATSIADIVTASGTSAGAIYHHFDSKVDIVRAVAARAIAVPLTAALAEQGPVSPVELFTLAANRVALDAESAPLLLQVWAGASSDPALHALMIEEAGPLRVGVAGHLQAWCNEHGIGDRALSVGQMVVGMVLGLIIQTRLFPEFDADAYVAECQAALSALT